MDPRIQDQPMEGDSLRSARQMAEDTRRLVDEIDTRVDPNGMTAAFEELTNMAHRLKEEIGALEERLSYVLVEPTVNDNASPRSRPISVISRSGSRRSAGGSTCERDRSRRTRGSGDRVERRVEEPGRVPREDHRAGAPVRGVPERTDGTRGPPDRGRQRPARRASRLTSRGISSSSPEQRRTL
jgi:hypothetical protein